MSNKEHIGCDDVVQDKKGNVYKIIWDGENSGGTPIRIFLVKEVNDPYVSEFNSIAVWSERLDELVEILGLKKIGKVVVTETIEYFK